MFERKYFIVAPRFHGVTLLSRLLNSHPQVVSLGDTYPSNRYEQACGCGVHVSACTFWNDIRARIESDRYASTPHMLPLLPDVLSTPFNERLLAHLPVATLRRLFPTAGMQIFVSDFRRFLEAIYAHFQAARPSVFVDGVKSSERVKALVCAGERVDGVLHVIRDPKDYVKSCSRIEGQDDLKSLIGFSRSWHRAHRYCGSLRKVGNYLRIDYEALCSDPDTTLDGIFRFMNVPSMTLTELRRQPEQIWHSTGNVSMSAFNWSISARKHPANTWEGFLIDAIARPATI
ncbi:MAG TPA: hypothetical protein VMF67_11770 [Rhizomicrobium sp.]|nr:hypothetical protein [Rhizomicrobium sp.]